MSARTRAAQPGDAEAIAAIYNEGIEDRLATFETKPRAAGDVVGWLGEFPVVVAEDEAGRVVAWASAPPSSPRRVYEGVREFSIYVARSERGRGHGRAALAALLAECEARGWWKVTSRIFPENEASLALCRALGFREVGVLRRHARLDGEWRDCVVVERLLGEAAGVDAPSRALREHAPELLGSGLRRLLVEGEQEWVKDWRDLLVVLAPYHDCARRLGVDPTLLFDAAADEGPATLRDVVRDFGKRRDVTPKAFGFEVVEGPEGPRYEFTH